MAASSLAANNDAAITSLKIMRVRDGEDLVRFHVPVLPDIEGWLRVDVPFFGTIGNRVQEAQTKENVAELRVRASALKDGVKPTILHLHFQLSSDRRDRDLDNLGDALMPLFNGWWPGLADIHLSKGPRQRGETETMWIAADVATMS